MASLSYYRSFGLGAVVVLASLGGLQLVLASVQGLGGLMHGNSQIVGRQFFEDFGPWTPWMDRHRLVPRQGYLFDRHGNRFFLGYEESFVRDVYGLAWRHPGLARQLADHIAAKELFFAERGIRYAFLVIPEKGLLYRQSWPGIGSNEPAGRLRFIEAVQQELRAKKSQALLYPLAELKAAPGRPYRVIDHHLNPGGSAYTLRLLFERYGLKGPYPHEDPAYGMKGAHDDSPELLASALPALKPIMGPAVARPLPLRMVAYGDSFMIDGYLGGALKHSLNFFKSVHVQGPNSPVADVQQALALRPDLVLDECYEPSLPWLALSAVKGFDPGRLYAAGPGFEAELARGPSAAEPRWDIGRGDLAFGFGPLPRTSRRISRPLHKGAMAEVYLREPLSRGRRLILTGHLEGGVPPRVAVWADGQPLTMGLRWSTDHAYGYEAELPAEDGPQPALRRVQLKSLEGPEAPQVEVTGLWIEG